MFLSETVVETDNAAAEGHCRSRVGANKGLTTIFMLHIIIHKFIRTKTIDGEKYSEFPDWKRAADGVIAAVGTGRMDFGGRLEQRVPLSRCRRGILPVIMRTRMMVREASGRYGVNLGGIAGVWLLSHVWDKWPFFCSQISGLTATIQFICHLNNFIGGNPK